MARYPDAPKPLLDLSTGINPLSYPMQKSDLEAVGVLPQQQAERDARKALARYLGIPAENGILLTPGSQIALSLLPHCLSTGDTGIIEPTYNEHRPAWTRAGHRTVSLSRAADIPHSMRHVVLVNPNNPDGTITQKPQLLALAETLRGHGGWLVVDEAFCDLEPDLSVAAEAAAGDLIVLRSFGKFFGLGGIRFGAVIGPQPVIDTLGTMIGPWAVSTPALAVATRAYHDNDWTEATRRKLANDRARLDELFKEAGFSLVGGTDLYRLYAHPGAADSAENLAKHGIMIRMFHQHPTWLRCGIPRDETAWRRLSSALET